MNEECFAFKHGECKVLTATHCEGCSFYKSKAQMKADSAKAMESIRNMPLGMQLHIADKYYGGEMPWMSCNVQ